MKKLLKVALFLSGLGIILGTIMTIVSIEQSIPEGVDFGFELFYFIAFVAGGILIFFSTRKHNKRDSYLE